MPSDIRNLHVFDPPPGPGHILLGVHYFHTGCPSFTKKNPKTHYRAKRNPYLFFINVLQEWEAKAAEDKKRYDAEMEKWLAEGGKEALAAAKKKSKALKRAEKRANAAASGNSTAKSKSSSKATTSKVDPKGGSGGGFKSKEFIEDSDSSNSD